MIAQCRPVFALQQKPWTTEKQYLHFIREYLWFTFTQPKEATSEQKFEAYLTHLAVKKDVAASTQNVAFNAVRWFYLHVLKRELQKVDALRATRPEQVRTALPMQDVLRLLEDVRDVGNYPTKLVVELLYRRGMRLGDAVNLRVKDIGFERSEIIVRGGKGGKDRVMALAPELVAPLQRQMLAARVVFERDVQAKIPIHIDGGLPRKYPEYRFSWHWAWLFPQLHPCRHPRTREIVRYRMPKDAVQRAVRESRRRLGLNPQLTPHVLRHSFATHLLDMGENIKALQEIMGHADMRTTAGYCHATAKSVPDPVEKMRMLAGLRKTTITIAPPQPRRLEFHPA